MSEPLHDRAAGLVLSPIGGLAIAALFFPVGCAVRTFPCPVDQRTNILDLTMGGLVGNVSEAGATLLGFLAAGVVWLMVGLFTDGAGGA